MISEATTEVHIDLGQLSKNIALLQRASAPAPIMGVVKADAYGHGAPAVCRRLLQAGVRHVAVATCQEAERLRGTPEGKDLAILVFAPPLPNQWSAMQALQLEANITSLAQVKELANLGAAEEPLRIHLKVDTGMHRLGVSIDEAREALTALQSLDGVRVESVWTHFATADLVSDSTYADHQWQLFLAWYEQLDPATRPPIHAANSPGLFTQRPSSQHPNISLTRPGIALYGMLEPQVDTASFGVLKPLLELRSRLTQVTRVKQGATISYGQRYTCDTDRWIGTVGGGYADGIPRLLTNQGHVSIHDQRYPMVGTICMDMFMVDLGDASKPCPASRGDAVSIFGGGSMPVQRVAEICQTIPYEICCHIGARVPRRYFG